MVVPIIGPDIAAVAGGLLVAAGAASVIGTLIVLRSVANWLTRWVDLIVSGAFRLAARHVADYLRRDRVLAAQADHHPDRAAGRQAGRQLDGRRAGAGASWPASRCSRRPLAR
jgi:hypothetical protein